MQTSQKAERLTRRKLHIRKRVIGSTERPRLTVYKSLKHLYAQLVDDGARRTLLAVTTNTKEHKADGKKSFANIVQAKVLGARIAEKAKEAGITTVVFDRNGFPYHGIVKAIAEAAREGGLKF